MPVRRLPKNSSQIDGVEKKATTILALLQNPYFPPSVSQRHIDMYRDNVKFHRMVLERTATGKALRRAFGDLYDEIIWDNANPRHGTTRNASFPPDSVYMANRIAYHDARVVLLFGKQAVAGWERILSFKDLVDLRIGRVVLTAPHPMAFGSAQDHLSGIVKKVMAI